MKDRAVIKRLLVRLQPLIALVLMIAVMGSLSDTFLTAENGWNILRQISVNVCLSIGMTLIILTGGIDLSVGSILAFSGAVAAGLLKHGIAVPPANLLIAFTASGAMIVALCVGLGLGAFNGLMITRLRIPPFVATLAMMGIARGLTELWTGGKPITGLGSTFETLGTGTAAGIPVQVWVYLVLVAVFVVITKKTRFGRHIYAVGGNERAARLSGLPVGRITFAVYAIGGALAAVAGLIVTARLDSARPSAGEGYELDSIAAVVIGGTSLSGGRGSVLGTLLGCLIIGVLNSGLVMLEVSPFWQKIVKGAVILAAVAIDRLNVRR
jgi:ribose transport system permease protein